MKEKPEKNGIDEDGHGLGHVKGDPGHVTSARDHVTENAAIEDEIPGGRTFTSPFCLLFS